MVYALGHDFSIVLLHSCLSKTMWIPCFHSSEILSYLRTHYFTPVWGSSIYLKLVPSCLDCQARSCVLKVASLAIGKRLSPDSSNLCLELRVQKVCPELAPGHSALLFLIERNKIPAPGMPRTTLTSAPSAFSAGLRKVV